MINIFKKDNNKINQMIDDLVTKRLQEEKDKKINLENKIILSSLHTPIIAISNEWVNPIVGFVEDFEFVNNKPIPIIHDYIENKKVICMGVRMDYSRQKLDAILKLDPFEACAVTYHNAVGFEKIDKNKAGERWENDKIIASLDKNGFFKKCDDFYKKLEEEINQSGIVSSRNKIKP